MPYAMLHSTAMEEASTPAAPLMPQNQGVGLASTAEINRIPVGKPNPSNKPAGAIIATVNAARAGSGALSACRSKGGVQ